MESERNGMECRFSLFIIIFISALLRFFGNDNRPFIGAAAAAAAVFVVVVGIHHQFSTVSMI